MRTLFVDFDGTICHDRFWRSLPEADLVQKTLFHERPEVVADWMRGKYTSEEINQLVAENTGIKYENLWDAFVSDCRTMRVADELLDILQKLRNQFYLVLITGNMDCFDRYTVPSLRLREHFDEIINSYDERCLKSEMNGQTFKKYVRGDVTNAILVEDSLQSCTVFQNLGGTALQVTSENNAYYHLQNILSGKF